MTTCEIGKKKPTDVEYKFWLFKFEILQSRIVGSKFNWCLKKNMPNSVLHQIHTPTLFFNKALVKFASSLLHTEFTLQPYFLIRHLLSLQVACCTCWVDALKFPFAANKKQTQTRRFKPTPESLTSSQMNTKSNTLMKRYP